MLLRLAFGVTFLGVLAAQEAQPAPRSADDILREFDRVSMPGMSDGNDAESARRFHAAIEAASRTKTDLALELLQAWPDHPRLPAVLGDRWALLANALHDQDAVIVETSMLLENQTLGRDLRIAATHARTHSLLLSTQATTAEKLRAVRELVAADPENELTGIALVDLVADHLADPAMMRPLLAAAETRWPNSNYVARPVRRWLALLDLVGKPFAAQVPAEALPAFDLATSTSARFTIVQAWMGWVPTAAGRPEIEALRALRDASGGDVALVGMYAEFRGQRGTPEDVPIDWPQIELPGGKGMHTPFGAPRLPVYFVLDADHKVLAVGGRATTLAGFVRGLRAAKR